jgi:hypothetical protein
MIRRVEGHAALQSRIRMLGIVQSQPGSRSSHILVPDPRERRLRAPIGFGGRKRKFQKF